MIPADAGSDLSVHCMGDDGMGAATIHVEGERIIVVWRDYGRLDLDKKHEEVAVPQGAVVNMYAPPKYPTSFK